MSTEPSIGVIDERTGKPADLSALEESGTAFDPTVQHIDLTKEEKRRTTALLMAIQAYKELIIKEADYLIAASDLARRGEGPEIRPATIDAMVETALKFECFIAGGYDQVLQEGEAEDVPAEEEKPDE